MISTLTINSSTGAKPSRLLNNFARGTNSVIRKLDRMIMQILKKVFAMSIDVYTVFLSSSKLIIRFAAVCCFVFSIFTSLAVSENNATSAPEIVNTSNSKATSRIIRKVVPCRFTASKIVER